MSFDDLLACSADEIKGFFQPLNHQEIKLVLLQGFRRTCQEGAPISWVSGYLDEALKNRELQLVFIQSVIEWFSDDDHIITERTLSDFVFTIKSKIYGFATNPLETFCLSLLECLRSEKTNPKIVSFLPIVVNQLMQKNSIFSVHRYFEHLCGLQWKERYVLALIAAFRDIKLTPETLTLLLKKTACELNGLSHCDLPAAIYHILLLCKKAGDIALEMQIIFSTLDCLDQVILGLNNDSNITLAKKKQALHAIGTALIHLNMTFKQDHTLGREYCKMLKAGKLAVSSLALLVSLTASAGYDLSVMDVFKTILINEQKKSDYEKHLKLALGNFESEDIGDRRLVHILETILECACHWDEVVVGLLKTLLGAFDLIDAGQLNKTNEMLVLGVEAFKNFDVCRDAVVATMVEKILNNAASKTFFDFFDALAKECPYELLAHSGHLQEFLDCLSQLDSENVALLSRPLISLANKDRHFKNNMLLAMKKCLFNKNMDSKLMAVETLFKLLAVHEQNEDVSIELLGCLKRAMQEKNCRQRLLLCIVLKQDEDTCKSESILELVLLQLRNTLNVNSLSAATNIFDCFATKGKGLHVSMTFASILAVTYRLHALGKNETRDMLMQICDNMRSFLLRSDLEDLNLDKTMSFSSETTEGRENLAHLASMIETFEVLVYYSIWELATIHAFPEHQIFTLVEKIMHLEEAFGKYPTTKMPLLTFVAPQIIEFAIANSTTNTKAVFVVLEKFTSLDTKDVNENELELVYSQLHDGIVALLTGNHPIILGGSILQAMSHILRHLICLRKKLAEKLVQTLNTHQFYQLLFSKLSSGEQIYEKELGTYLNEVCLLLEDGDNRAISQEWFVNAIKDLEIRNSALSRHMIHVLMKLPPALDSWRIVTSNICYQLEPLEDSNAFENPPIRIQSISKKNALSLLTSVLRDFELFIPSFEWYVNYSSKSNLANAHQQNIILIIEAGSSMLKMVAQSHSFNVAANLLKLAQRFYRILCALTKNAHLFSERTELFRSFCNTIVNYVSPLTSSIYPFITAVQDGEIERADSKNQVAAIRNTKLVPNVIYQIEQFERTLIQLHKKTKVDLLRHFKRSTTRDFRIRLDSIENTESNKRAKA